MTTSTQPALPGFAVALGSLAHLRTTQYRRKFPSESPYPVGDPFLKCLRKILCSKAYRRLAGKTQVLTNPANGHIRDRAAHTAEVAACSMTVADVLGLNAMLCQAIAFGHDIGHVPFGHQGEEFIAKRIGRPFTHEVMGLIIAQQIERDGRGLNLSWEVLDGMLRHGGSRASPTMTPEASVVRVCDKIAYIFADFNDLLRVHYPVRHELHEAMNSFGHNQRERVNRVIEAFCQESIDCGRMSFDSSPEARDFTELKKLMYEVYGKVTLQDVSRILGPIYDFLEQSKIHDPALLLALMTDRDVMFLHEQRFLNVDHVMQTSVGELIPHLPREIDLCKIDLDW